MHFQHRRNLLNLGKNQIEIRLNFKLDGILTAEFRVKDLRPAHISEMIENMVQWDREAGQYIPLKAKTVQNHLIPLNDILQDALANKQIAEDPMKHIFLTSRLFNITL